jgi:hypothetical protein
MLEER